MTNATGFDNNHGWLKQPRLPLYLAILSMVLTLPVLTLGLQFDDLVHRAILLGQVPDRYLQDLSLFGLFSWFDADSRPHLGPCVRRGLGDSR